MWTSARECVTTDQTTIMIGTALSPVLRASYVLRTSHLLLITDRLREGD